MPIVRISPRLRSKLRRDDAQDAITSETVKALGKAVDSLLAASEERDLEFLGAKRSAPKGGMKVEVSGKVEFCLPLFVKRASLAIRFVWCRACGAVEDIDLEQDT